MSYPQRRAVSPTPSRDPANSILLTDYLLQHLTKREVDAVLAHEMSHLKLKHPRKLTWVFLASMGGAAILAAGLTRMGLRSIFYAGVVLVPLIVAYFFSRRFEFAADATAVGSPAIRRPRSHLW